MNNVESEKHIPEASIFGGEFVEINQRSLIMPDVYKYQKSF